MMFINLYIKIDHPDSRLHKTVGVSGCCASGVILIRNPIFSENPGVSPRLFETRPQSAESACLVMLVESPVGHESSSAEDLPCGTASSAVSPEVETFRAISSAVLRFLTPFSFLSYHHHPPPVGPPPLLPPS